MLAGSRASASFGSHGRLSDTLGDADSYLHATASPVGGVGGEREWNLSTEARSARSAVDMPEMEQEDTASVVPAAYDSFDHGTMHVEL